MYRDTVRERLSAWLAAHAPAEELRLRPPVEPIEEVPPPLRLLYRVADGQVGPSALFDGYRFLTLADARAEKAMMDRLAKDEGWDEAWWSARWHPFASDGMGQLLVVDDEAVIEFLHDDDPRPVLARSVEDYLEDFVTSLETGERVFDAKIGVVEVAQLERQHAYEAERAARDAAAKRTSRRVTVVMIVASAVLALVMILVDRWLRS